MNITFAHIIYTALEYFLVYSFLGWCTEVAYQAIAKGLIINRGFLNGPICPIYGFGVIAVFLMLEKSGEGELNEQNALEVFIFGVVLSTAIELFGGWLLDKLFHARWWDYSKKPFNLKGYICLEFSIIWGLGILVVVRAVNPMIMHILGLVPHKIGWIFIVIFSATFIADIIVSVMVMLGLNKRMAEIDEMRKRMRVVSNDLSERIATRAMDTAQKVDEAKADYETRRQEFEAKKKELALRLRKSRHFGSGRLLRAFPDMQHRDYAELIEMLREQLSEFDTDDLT